MQWGLDLQKKLIKAPNGVEIAIPDVTVTTNTNVNVNMTVSLDGIPLPIQQAYAILLAERSWLQEHVADLKEQIQHET
jgi:hypothetical protein